VEEDAVTASNSSSTTAKARWRMAGARETGVLLTDSSAGACVLVLVLCEPHERGRAGLVASAFASNDKRGQIPRDQVGKNATVPLPLGNINWLSSYRPPNYLSFLGHFVLSLLGHVFFCLALAEAALSSCACCRRCAVCGNLSASLQCVSLRVLSSLFSRFSRRCVHGFSQRVWLSFGSVRIAVLCSACRGEPCPLRRGNTNAVGMENMECDSVGRMNGALVAAAWCVFHPSSFTLHSPHARREKASRGKHSRCA
jgi:hypothetical protein